MEKLTYTEEQLFQDRLTRCFTQDDTQAKFLLGGIGTGNISLCSTGALTDFEIFNKPDKGYQLPFTFFALYTKAQNKASDTRVLQCAPSPPHANGHGYSPGTVAGLPAMESSVMKGEYPFCTIDFTHTSLPVKVSLRSYTPFIPHDPKNSAIPCAIFEYNVCNLRNESVDVSIAGSMSNAYGHRYADTYGGHAYNKTVKDRKTGITGIVMDCDADSSKRTYGNNFIGTLDENCTIKPEWYNGGWWDGIQDAWDDFREDGKMEEENRVPFEQVRHEKQTGTVAAMHTLAPYETRTFVFILSWYFPNRKNAWSQMIEPQNGCDCDLIKNRYGVLFDGAYHAARYVAEHFEKLRIRTERFHDALYSSTYPSYVLDALASNITVIRSTTCFWLENGKFFGWEGCSDKEGCCMGNCTHVWNYAQTLAFLFPSLERSMRDTEYNYETDAQGNMHFRSNQLFGERVEAHPAADGQLGCIIRLYRDWKLCGDDSFLQSVWPNAKKALDFAFEYWDRDNDFVLESQQHNTYDIEFYGPNSLVNSMFFGALKAGVAMATAMGDSDSAERYQQAFEIGSEKMDRLLYNGRYYVQKIENINQFKYQYQDGCLSDQLFGQLCAHIAGLGYVLNPDHVKTAIKSVFMNNFRTDFSNHHNVQRTYALKDDRGLVLCSWNNVKRPIFPFVYSDEVWTGIEYQVAAHLIIEGYLKEGLTLVKAVRDRHDGKKRNPWNEVECGHHYARSLASWSVLIALSGFSYDMHKKTVSFTPKMDEQNFQTFWSTGTAWGTYSYHVDENGEKIETFDVIEGDRSIVCQRV